MRRWVVNGLCTSRGLLRLSQCSPTCQIPAWPTGCRHLQRLTQRRCGRPLSTASLMRMRNCLTTTCPTMQGCLAREVAGDKAARGLGILFSDPGRRCAHRQATSSPNTRLFDEDGAPPIRNNRLVASLTTACRSPTDKRQRPPPTASRSPYLIAVSSSSIGEHSLDERRACGMGCDSPLVQALPNRDTNPCNSSVRGRARHMLER